MASNTTLAVDDSITTAVDVIQSEIEADPDLVLPDLLHEEADHIVAYTDQSDLLAYLADRDPDTLREFGAFVGDNPSWDRAVEVAAFLTVEQELRRRLHDECPFIEHGEIQHDRIPEASA